MSLDQPAGMGETETASSPGWLFGEEGFEGMLESTRCEAGPPIGHRDPQVSREGSSLEEDAGIGARSQGIVDELTQHFLHQPIVEHDAGKVGFD